jgi:regulatory protein
MSETSNDAAKSSAFRLLNYRPRSVSEIKRRLLEKYDQESVQITLSWLLENGLLNDEKFATWWTESRVRQKFLSSSMIRRELLEKGVSSNTINKALISVDDNLNARQLAEKMARNASTQDLTHFKRKLYSKLMRKGFSSGVALASIERAGDSLIESKEISLEQ